MSSPHDETDRLFSAWLSGALAEGDARRLIEVLRNPGHRRRWRALADLEGALSERGTAVAAEPASTESAMHPATKRNRTARVPWWRGRLPVGLAMAAGLLLVVGLVWHAQAGVITGPSVSAGGGWIEHDGSHLPMSAGQERTLSTGDRLVAEVTAAAIRFDDGTAIDLAAGGSLRLEADGDDAGKTLRLEQGVITAVVAKQLHPMRLLSAQAEAEVLGTRLKFAVSAQATRLEVTEGSVRLQRRGEAVQVKAGEFALAQDGMPFTARPLSVAPKTHDPAAYAGWRNGIATDPAFFPIAVWMQDVADAQAYRKAGINLYLGLWQGPTEADLAALSAAGLRTICAPNEVALRHLAEPTIAGWLRTSEIHPDGCGTDFPPVEPSEVRRRYDAIAALDPTRPVYLHLSPGAAWSDYPGRGRHLNLGEDYRGYVAGGDILGVEIYPVNMAEPAVNGNLWYVANGVDRLLASSDGAKPVWSWIECTRLTAASPAKPTPAQVRSEAWMALIHGACGIGYFCHSWASGTEEQNAPLRDPEMLAAITALNREITALAPMLNSRDEPGGVTVISGTAAVPVDALVKRHLGTTYIFAAAMRAGATTATIAVPAGTTVEVLGESRSLPIVDGVFSDRFESFAVHLYAIPDRAGGP